MAGIGAAVFGGVVLIMVLAGVFFVVALNSQQPAITDTYGNAQSNTTNSSQGLVGNVTGTQGMQLSIPMILIVGAVLAIMVIFGFYLAAKTFFQ